MKKTVLLLLLFALLAAVPGFGQTKGNKKIIVAGTVVDINKNPVADAIIIVDGKSSDVYSDQNGLFKVKVKPDAEVIEAVSEKGCSGKTKIDGKSDVTITLDPSEVSNAKYIPKRTREGSKGRQNNPNEVNPQENRYASYSSVYEILKGIPGVQVAGTSITIRGATSINSSTEPLLIVNGSQVLSLYDISPKDVKRITVLKGAETAIYGAKGANGVIVIELIGPGK